MTRSLHCPPTTTTPSSLPPSFPQVREVAQYVAAAVAQSAIADGIAEKLPPGGVDLRQYMASLQYQPLYHPIINDVFR